MSEQPTAAPPFRWSFILPIAAFAGLAAALWVGLYLNPREIPSALIGRPVPNFDLPPLPGRQNGLSSADLKQGKVTILNVFASWCVPCRIEHPILTNLSKQPGIRLYALNYKDEPQAALTWLAQNGDPYGRIGMDRDGRAAIEFGVYGVPETFVIDGEGRIAFKHVGPLTEDAVKDKILPLVAKLSTP